MAEQPNPADGDCGARSSDFACCGTYGRNIPARAIAQAHPPAGSRPRLLEFRQAIDAREACLRRDECGDWSIFGRLGHIYAVPEGFQLFVSTGESARRWAKVKDSLSFCHLTQDGDDKGCFILDRLPSSFEGEPIREALGIPKAKRLSEEHRAKLIASGAQTRFQGQKIAKSGSDGQRILPEPDSGNLGEKHALAGAGTP